MKNFTKDNIIKNMELIISYENYKNNLDKSNKYSLFIKNLRNYPNDIKYLKDLDNINGFTKDIKDFMKELKKNNEISYIKNIINNDNHFIPFNKDLIIKNLEIIRNYEIYNNEVLKVKAYNLAISKWLP